MSASAEPTRSADQPARIILGGVTEQGYLTARYIADSWASEGFRVIWFDGWSTGSEEVPQNASFAVVRHGHLERNRLSVRFERRLSGASDGAGRVGGRLRSWLATRVRRWNTATRGYGSWRTIKSELRLLAREVTPERVVYCDDHAATAAWHAARIWQDCPVTRA